MYDLRPNILLGFHGCDLETRNKLISSPNNYKISKKPYDWLGHGMYFWENNYTRAWEWAKSKADRKEIEKPAVVGAVLYLGYCCDFLDSKFIKLITKYHEVMKQNYEAAGKVLPENKDGSDDIYKNKLVRLLDCATIEFMHSTIEEQWQKETDAYGMSDTKLFDSTRGVFMEGRPAYQGAGLFEKSHIQICIRNPNCIKGFFIPRDEKPFP